MPPAAGGQPDGILQDDQWNTYDEALHGVTTFISGYYLAALRAGEEWARRVGDAGRGGPVPRASSRRGRRSSSKLCWNGEYFQQHLPDYMKRPGRSRAPAACPTSSSASGGRTSLAWATSCRRRRCVSALRAVFKYNFKSDLTGWQARAAGVRRGRETRA